MKIASIQFCPDWVAPIFQAMKVPDALEAKRGNLQRLVRLIEQAAAGGAQLVVLPELATTGYSFMNDAEARPHAELVRSGPTTMIMKALAKKLGIHVVWGMMELSETGKLFNSQIYSGPDGYLESYAKINFFASDWLWATAGRANPPVISAPFGGKLRKIGLLICRDVRDKKDSDWSSFYSPGDAEVVALSANWGKGGFPATAWMDFAEENSCHLVVANRYGVEGPNEFDFGMGGSCIISPEGRVQCEGLQWGKDCIVFGEVP